MESNHVAAAGAVMQNEIVPLQFVNVVGHWEVGGGGESQVTRHERSSDPVGLCHGASAQGDVDAFFDQVHHAIGEDQIARYFWIAIEKFGEAFDQNEPS